MGTRHLIAVFIDGEYKIAQYGQWDGYPSGQGGDVLEFISGMDKEHFKDKCRKARFFTKDEAEEVNKELRENQGLLEKEMKYWHLNRYVCAKILKLVNDSPDGMILENKIYFAGNSLFCEWAYVIDFDTDKLEVYTGFNKSPLPKGSRFEDIKIDKEPSVSGDGQRA